MTNFKRVRLDAGYSNLRALERDCGVEHQSLFDYDHGKAVPSLPRAVRLMKFFNGKVGIGVNINDVWGDAIIKYNKKHNIK